VTEIDATVRREDLVKLDHLPILLRVPSIPELPQGSRVRLAVEHYDYLSLDLACRYQSTLADTTADATTAADANEPSELTQHEGGDA
jgi:exoribonuclease-2